MNSSNTKMATSYSTLNTISSTYNAASSATETAADSSEVVATSADDVASVAVGDLGIAMSDSCNQINANSKLTPSVPKSAEAENQTKLSFLVTVKAGSSSGNAFSSTSSNPFAALKSPNAAWGTSSKTSMSATSHSNVLHKKAKKSEKLDHRSDSEEVI